VLRRRSTAVVAAVITGATLILAVPARSIPTDARTARISVAGIATGTNGPSRHPAVSATGTFVAFDSASTRLAPDPNGSVRDVFVRDVPADTTRLVSAALDGGGADGPSLYPTLSGDGGTVAFTSGATNLVSGDANRHADVYVRTATGPVVRVSVDVNGADADGDSSQPDISADGRRVVFTSRATDLVQGDGDGVPDVFVRDLLTGTTVRVSRALEGESDGPSSDPAISPDGRWVSFFSTASNLVADDANGVGDVFLADLIGGRVRRVSVSSAGVEQNRAARGLFAQTSDVSRDGRFVTFDSLADNLVAGDTNVATDVYVRDVRARRTSRVSVDAFALQGDRDSFFPVITPGGRYVGFTSAARNLVRGDPAGEDLFVYDTRRFVPTLADVGPTGKIRGTEHARVAQRMALDESGTVAAFSTTADRFADADVDGLEDVFLRGLAAPRARLLAGPSRVTTSRRPRYRLSADDPAGNRFLCSVDLRRFPCSRAGRLPRLAPGRHVLRVRAGGLGMLFQNVPLVRRFTVR